MTNWKNLILIVLMFLPAACSRGTAGRPETSKAAGNAEEATPAPPAIENKLTHLNTAAGGSGSVRLSPEALNNFKWLKVAERPRPRNLIVTGKVQFNEDNTARILAPLAGQVVELCVHVGDSVDSGETLFSLRSREAAQLMTEYMEISRDMELAEKTLAMISDLFQHQAASRFSLEQAENEVAKNKAKLSQSLESLNTFELSPPQQGGLVDLNIPIHVKSPISGTIVERTVTAGQYVQPESGPLLTIADLSTVWVLADVFERDIAQVRPGLRAEITTTAYSNEKFTARVARLNDVVDPETRTVKVRFLVPNPGRRLKPEMFASVSLFLAESEPALAVAPAAVFTENGSSYVFVREAGDQIRRRRIEVSSESENDIRVISGLRAGETIVSEGTLLVRQLERRGGDQ